MRNLRIFYRTFLICSLIGFIIDFLFNGFRIVAIDVLSDSVMNILLAAISVYICGEFERKMDMDDAINFLENNSKKIIEKDNVIIGELGKYKEFFMGNIQYDKKRGVITGPKVVVKKEQLMKTNN